MTSPVSRASSGGRRQRVLWDSDNVSREGKTSICILLEWLLAPGNYERWRDGKPQAGETREALCSEIKCAMQQHGINHRENANIRTQISELERSFDAAREWLKQNKYDPFTFKRETDEDEPVILGGPAESHVLRMCRYYHTLNEIFGRDGDKGTRNRRTCQQRTGGVNPGLTKKRKLVREEGDVHELEPQSETLAEDQREQIISASDSASMAATTSIPASNTIDGAASSAANVTDAWANPAALESTQRMLSEAVREERERKRFCMEEERNKLKCEKLRCEVEALKLKLTIDRALARKKLHDAGLSEDQVNELFPVRGEHVPPSCDL